MLYSILAYHEENAITSMSPEEDAALMTELLSYHNGLVDQGKMGPAARLDFTAAAFTLRGPGAGDVIDGPFAETKEALLGLYVVDCASRDEVVEIARGLRRANPTAVYEIRPIALYVPGNALAAPKVG
ncbi:MAG: YciI family protein [Rhizobiaceae bacterium]